MDKPVDGFLFRDELAIERDEWGKEDAAPPLTERDKLRWAPHTRISRRRLVDVLCGGGQSFLTWAHDIKHCDAIGFSRRGEVEDVLNK